MTPRTFLFNFKRQFADDVEAGRKLQTVRKTRADNRVPRPGDTVKLYTGLRTRAARRLGASVVVDCFPVHMDLAEPPTIVSNGVRLNPGEASAFARLDGFENAAAMFAWFRQTHGEDFEGFCVRWRTPTRPE
jgi:hypothetical protein